MSLALSSRRRRAGAAAASAIAVVSASVSFGMANASTQSDSAHHQVLHYFLKNQTEVFRTAAGKVFTPSPVHPPVPGDQEQRTDLDYVGNRAHHAKHWTATDIATCLVAKNGDLDCQGEFAIGGSMIVVEATLTHPAKLVTYHVTGGTGRFRGVSGTLTDVGVNDESTAGNVTISLHR